MIKAAVAAFERTTSLYARLRSQEAPVPKHVDAVVEVFANATPYRFIPEVRRFDRFKALGTLKAREFDALYPLLLITPYVSREAADRCRQLKLAFMDQAGNAYLEAQGLFVYVTGNPRPEHVRSIPGFRALTPAGLRIVFALLTRPDLLNASYRNIANAAGVALGTIGEVLADLEKRGHLKPEKLGERRLLAADLLLEEWVTHYPIKLRPKLNARRFTAVNPAWWRTMELEVGHAWWGGEVAAEKLTGYLKPANVTVYFYEKPDPIILANRLRPDVNGEVEMIEAFWNQEAPGGMHPASTAPPLVVYADLMATTDARNIETAKIIYDRYIADSLRKV